MYILFKNLRSYSLEIHVDSKHINRFLPCFVGWSTKMEWILGNSSCGVGGSFFMICLSHFNAIENISNLDDGMLHWNTYFDTWHSNSNFIFIALLYATTAGPSLNLLYIFYLQWLVLSLENGYVCIYSASIGQNV